MGTSPLARRTANLVNTQIAFCRLDYGLAGNLIKDKPALGISHLNHADVVVGQLLAQVAQPIQVSSLTTTSPDPSTR